MTGKALFMQRLPEKFHYPADVPDGHKIVISTHDHVISYGTIRKTLAKVLRKSPGKQIDPSNKSLDLEMKLQDKMIEVGCIYLTS